MLLRRNSALIALCRRSFTKSGPLYLHRTTARTMATFREVVNQLNEFAPTNLAEKWDNVGVLVEPRNIASSIDKILLTIDLTEAVVKEAQELDAQMIISYHPPLFAPLKQLTQGSWKERIVMDCIRSDIAIYSPHTAWDNINGGLNDWLADSLPYATCRPIQENSNDPKNGAGRFCEVKGDPVVERDAAQLIMKHTGVDSAMISFANGGSGAGGEQRKIRTYAVCAGSGASVLKGVKADLYITGEMSHHDVLEATSNGTCVVLLGHSNSERGFLRVFRDLFAGHFEKATFHVSNSDREPMQLVLREDANF